jgi:phospholipase C
MHLNKFAGESRFFAGVAAAGFLALASLAGHAGTGTIQDVQHVVILMEENRSFDHYCGCMGGVRGYNDRNPLLFSNGQSDFYQYQGGSYVLPFPLTNQCINDVPHDNRSGVADWDNGKWDQWIPSKGVETMACFTPDYIPLHYALINAYTVCDNYFCSLIGPTYPNRLYLFTGMIDPNGTGGGPALANSIPLGGFSWTTYPECLQTAGVSWKVYRPYGDNFGDVLPWFAQFTNAPPGSPLYDQGVAWSLPDVVTALQTDVNNGTLPQVSWVIPTLPQSGHPPYSPADGEVFIESVLNALASNPAVLNSTVFILTYDENDGLFDHIPAPTAPPGTAGEYVNGEPLGLGIRVPMIIISPWSRGGRVCSQVFDHTSIIRFIETWTGVQETNISAWRRQVCGDLTSAFDFAHPNTNCLPVLPIVSSYEVSPYAPVPPAVQALPVQQTNTLLSMPLPYQPEVTAQTDCAAQLIHLTLANAGSASVHFAIYANPVQTNGPLQCDVGPGNSLAESFPAAAIPAGNYDLTCYGPNGFQRRFAGNLANDCNQIEAVSSIDTNAGSITLALQNATASAVEFILTDGYGLGGPWTNNVPPGLAASNVFAAVAENNGWYDLTVTAASDAGFVRHYTGHIETGAIMATEPALPQAVAPPPPSPPPPPPPIVPVVLTNAHSLISLMAAIPAVPATNSFLFYAVSVSTNVVLVYPAWASNCTVMASASLTPSSWSPLNVTLTNIGNYAVAVMPFSPDAMFFRLQQ